MKDSMYKKINNGGGICIPARMRAELGLQAGQAMELLPQEDGNILIKPYEYACIFCGSKDVVVTLKGKGVCKECEQILHIERKE